MKTMGENKTQGPKRYFMIVVAGIVVIAAAIGIYFLVRTPSAQNAYEEMLSDAYGLPLDSFTILGKITQPPGSETAVNPVEFSFRLNSTGEVFHAGGRYGELYTDYYTAMFKRGITTQLGAALQKMGIADGEYRIDLIYFCGGKDGSFSEDRFPLEISRADVESYLRGESASPEKWKDVSVRLGVSFVSKPGSSLRKADFTGLRDSLPWKFDLLTLYELTDAEELGKREYYDLHNFCAAEYVYHPETDALTITE